MLHGVTLLADHQRIINVKVVRMFNYCFIKVSDYMLIFVLVFSIGLGDVALRICWPTAGGYYVETLGSRL